MGERLPEPERPTYASARDEALHVMAVNAWACESCGSSTDDLGYTAWMSNSEAELSEIVDAFREEFEQVGLADPRELIGHWLINETAGTVEVLSFETEDEVHAAYSRIEALYDQVKAEG